MTDEKKEKTNDEKYVLIIGDEEIYRKTPLYPREYCFTVSNMGKSDFGKDKNWWNVDFWDDLDKFLGDKKFNIVHIDIGSDLWLLDENQEYLNFKHGIGNTDFMKTIIKNIIKKQRPGNNNNTVSYKIMVTLAKDIKKELRNYCTSVFTRMMDVIIKHLDDKFGLFLLRLDGKGKIYTGESKDVDKINIVNFYKNMNDYLIKNGFKANNFIKVKVDDIGDVFLQFLSKNDLGYSDKDKINEVIKLTESNNNHISSMLKNFKKNIPLKLYFGLKRTKTQFTKSKKTQLKRTTSQKKCKKPKKITTSQKKCKKPKKSKEVQKKPRK
jgi:hypothetical protein